jgi:hypothetical protein
LALLDWLGIEEVVFGMTGRLGKKEVGFGPFEIA